MSNGVDPNEQLIEVSPMAHSFSGGIKVNENYESTLKGFYAVGEACGGIHGACRCAGNAASQALLSGMICAENIAKNISNFSSENKILSIKYNIDMETYNKFVPLVKEIAVNTLGIYRDGEVLKSSFDQLAAILKNDDLKKDTQSLQIVESIFYMVTAALKREESRGTHMRIDFPEQSTAFEHEIII